MELLRKTSFSFLLVFFSSFLFAVCKDPYIEKEILHYRPPKWIRENYPYFLSGHSKKGSPVWVSQFGKWDVRSIIEEGGSKVKELDKYMEQGWEVVTRPLMFKSPEKKPTQGVVGIVDLDGYTSRQLYHFGTVQRSLAYVQQFVQILDQNGSHIERGYLINCNWYFRVLWRMVRPLLGNLVKNIELYGYDRAEWEPAIRQYVDSDQLPLWGGGDSENYQPIYKYG